MFSMLYVLLALILTFVLVNTFPIPKINEVMMENMLRDYLMDYGYMEKNDSNGNMTEAIKEMQQFIGIEPTGVMDGNTMRVVMTPRCGMPDKVKQISKKRQTKRFRFRGPPYLSYEILNKPKTGLKMAAVEEVMAQALAVWSNVTDLQFISTETTDQLADISISFVPEDHGDGKPVSFMQIAHAFYPTEGEMHIYEGLGWEVRGFKALCKLRCEDLFTVAVHEFGHVLGLMHVNDTNSIMHSMAMGHIPNFTLHAIDINNIQELYGPKTVEEIPDICCDMPFDAIFADKNGLIYIFKDAYYWILYPDGLQSTVPKKISHYWRGLPSKMDAALTDVTGITYFFKDKWFWSFNGTKPMHAHKLIKDRWNGFSQENIKAVISVKKSEFIFFKGHLCWEYKPNERVRKRTVIGTWPGVHWSNVDNVLHLGDYTYFFSRKNYVRFNHKTGMVDGGEGYSKFPRDISSSWLRCNKKCEEPESTNECNGIDDFSNIDCIQ